ncbi:hypothetical protein N6H18_12965 [Reichenbachiella agarivorans]|uniref:Uncharacterized protein n=1 Tax=Reichenbachiella agarivorans TaxID=2979464 RepID=A0ABY6CSJ8_9BACT|nr:hypothetical protein [Reichenbachiella agarivorans]UXP31260.1 hypothetical protein N6H18_12965 [Reichenbachiella agarivorans]
MSKKYLILTILMMLFCFAAMCQDSAQGKGTTKDDAKKEQAFHIHQHVMVTMSDGRQVEAVVHGHISKNKYWVREYHGGKQGKVKAKYMRPMSEQEVADLKKK